MPLTEDVPVSNPLLTLNLSDNLLSTLTLVDCRYFVFCSQNKTHFYWIKVIINVSENSVPSSEPKIHNMNTRTKTHRRMNNTYLCTTKYRLKIKHQFFSL